MDFEAIPGVGEKTAAALASVDDAAEALERGDVAGVAKAPGISVGKAARITRAVIRKRHDDTSEFLATDRAREVYEAVLGLLQDRAVTAYGRHRLETLYPSAKASRIEEVRAFSERAIEREPNSAVREALGGVQPLESPGTVRVRDRCVATADAEVYSRAREALPEVSVEIVDDARALAELARGYSTVIAVDEAFAGVEVDGDVRVDPDVLERPVDVVPERVLAFFAANQHRIVSAIEVHRQAGLEAPGDLDAVESALARLEEDGTVMGDPELRRLRSAVTQLDGAVADAVDVANTRLRAAIRERDVTIEGADLLSLVEQGAGVDSILARELAEEFDTAIEAARDHLVDALELHQDEARIAVQAFPEDPTFPVAADDAVVSRLREDLTRERDRRATALKRDLAQELAEAREGVERVVRDALELDVELAVAQFARDYGCVLPEFGGTGFLIEGGRCPLVDAAFEDIEPVDYHVSGVAVLSGVNSGGKTSTLDLVATVSILAQMGLPVPATTARIQRFDALHYYTKSQGTVDAGAFEATVRSFGELVAADGDILVLVDELESITEPGASARIIAGILEALADRPATAVFVSHLAAEIRDAVSFDLTVDGIEATGVTGGELQVNRSPVKDHLARSTPELIVEQLAAAHDSPFYQRLLAKFADE